MWFTETPWPPILILSLIGVGFLLVAMQTQHAKWLFAVIVVAVLAVAVWFAERAIVTPAEQVEGNLLAMIDAFQKNNEAEMLKFISPGQPALVALAKVGIQVVDMDAGYRVTDVQVKTFADNTAATSHFRVNSTIRMAQQGNLGHNPFRFNGQWQLEAGEWRLTGIEELDPITGEVLNRFDMLKTR